MRERLSRYGGVQIRGSGGRKPEDRCRRIIALTANDVETDVQKSLEAGMNEHLSKPVEPDVVFRTLEDLIAG